MKIFYKDKNWTQAPGFAEALVLKTPVRIAFVGSGGKTSILMWLAEEQKELGRKVLVLTTTHMFKPPEYGVFSGLAEDVEKMLGKDGIAVVGKATDGGKIMWQGNRLYREIVPMADVVLVEADGSRRLPAKFPNEDEPVILPDTDLILAVSGLGAIGRKGMEACHRWELARRALNMAEEEVLGPGHLCALMEKGYLIPLRKKYPQMSVMPVFNQADDDTLMETGKKMIDMLKTNSGIVSSLKAEVGA